MIKFNQFSKSYMTMINEHQLCREMGYRNYNIEDNPTLLFRPFVNLYFGAAYIKWLFSYNGK